MLFLFGDVSHFILAVCLSLPADSSWVDEKAMNREIVIQKDKTIAKIAGRKLFIEPEAPGRITERFDVLIRMSGESDACWGETGTGSEVILRGVFQTAENDMF